MTTSGVELAWLAPAACAAAFLLIAVFGRYLPSKGVGPITYRNPGVIRAVLVRAAGVPGLRRRRVLDRVVHRGRERVRSGHDNRRAVGGDARPRDVRCADGAGVLAGLHAGRTGSRLVLRRPLPLCRVHAGALAGRQPAAHIHCVGACGRVLLPADRLLVREAVGG